MNNYTIFISSSDSYSDIWDLFFDLFVKYWPQYEGEIVLNTENLDYTYENLNIRCTKVGKLENFGETFRAGLNKVYSDNVLLIMIDYIFMNVIDHDKLEEYFDFFLKENLDSLCLEWHEFPNIRYTEHPDLIYVLPPAPNIMFSFQVAFWKKIVLHDIVLPHENPWMAEWYGSKRVEKMKIKLSAPKEKGKNVIPYDLAGCLHQGKWMLNAVTFLKSINYEIDFSKRGYYQNEYETLKSRLKIKFMIFRTGLKGSYISLWRRKNVKN